MKAKNSKLHTGSVRRLTAIVVIGAFLFNTVFIDLVWAYSANHQAKNSSFLRAIPAEKAWVAKAIGEKLGKKETDEGNIASGNWTEEYHNELNAQIRELIGKKGTDVTRHYPVEKQKKELNGLLKNFFASLSEEEKAKWNDVISDANLAVRDAEELFKKLAGLLDSKKTGFFYLKPPKGVFYLKRPGMPPLIAEEHFGHNRKSKSAQKEINNVYIAEPSVKLKTNEEQQGIILHGLVHLLIGAGDAEHNFASKVQMRFERYLLEKEIPADFLKRYGRYYELKSEILEAEKANDNSLYQKKRAELIKTVDYLRGLGETVPDEQFKRTFELLRLNQIENQEDVNLMLGSFDEFYHLSIPEYNNEEKAVLEEIAREMAQGFKKWHNPDEVYQEAMSVMKPFHIKNLLPESIDEENDLKRRFLSRQIKNNIQVCTRAKNIGAAFTRGLETVSVLTKGLGNRDSSVPFLKATVKHELIHYFSFKGIIPIRYEREDISTAITVIEFLEQEGMEIFNRYQDFFTPVGAELYQAGAELQRQGKVFLDEDYLLKRAFEIFEADERLRDNAIMLVRDPAGKNAEETALLTAQVNDMRQRVIGVIMAGVLIQHSKESGEPLLETLIEFFKVLSEKMAIPRVAEIEEAIRQAKEMGVPEKDRQELNELLKQAKKQKAEVEKAKIIVVSWAKRATGIPGLSYVEAGGKIPQWAFLPAPHEKVVGVEEDLYRLSTRAAYGLVVPPVFEAKYGANVREKVIEDEFKNEPYFDLLYRIMDTPRIMAFGWHSYPGTIDWVKAVYEERFKEDNLLIVQTLLSAWARPLQYLDSFIYRWFKEIDEDRRLKNEDVRRAIENTRDAYHRVMETIAPEELYHLVKDEIWPEFKKLIDEEIAEQKDMELFKQEHQGISPNQIQQIWNGMSEAERQAAQEERERQWQAMSEKERQKIIDEVERQIQEAIEEYLAQSSRAQAGGERTSPSPAIPGQAGSLIKPSGFSQKPAEGKSEDMNRLAGQLQRMAERLKEKAENLSRQSNQTGGGTKGLSKEAEDVEGNAGAADLSKDVEELAKTAQETAEGFSFLKKQTEQFKNRANSLNETAKQSSNLESADEVKQNSEKLNRTAEDMDRTAGKGKEVSQEAVGNAKQIKDIISKSGRREVNAIRQKAEEISKKADELAKYAQDLAGQAGKAEEQAGEVGQSASEMGMETAQRAEDEKQKTGDGRRETENEKWEKGEGRREKEDKKWETGDPEGQAYGAGGRPRRTSLRGRQSRGGESSWDMTEEAREPESLKGMDSLAQQAREKNIAEAGEFDLSKYLEEEPSIPAPKEEISKRTKEQIREHEARMKKIREENFLKKEGITVDQYQSYQRAKISVQSQIANIERELKSILVPGGGGEFLRERSYGEIDDDSLAEIPAGRTKIFKQQQIPKKKKAIISLLVDISGSMSEGSGEKFKNAVLTAVAFQEALKKFEFSSQVDLQFEVAGYRATPYFYLKDYKDKLTIKQAYNVVEIIKGQGYTSDYQALSLAVQRMRQTKLGNDPEAKKIVLNITDGNAGRNAESIQKLYAQNPDIRIISFGIDENEETARAVALSYGPRYGVAVSDISTVPKAVMRRLKLELKRPVSPNNIAATIVNNTLIFGFTSLSGLISMGTAGLIQFMKDVDFNKLPKEEPVYEGSKFLIVRDNRKEFLVYRDPETEEEKIRIERGPRSNKRVPKIEWNPAFETEQNIEFLIKMFQRLYHQEEDNLMRNLLLSGEAGTGKNVLIEYAAKLANQNLRLMSIHKRTDKNQLIKRRTFGEEKSPDGKYLRKTGWANSELVEAAINGDWITLDEINKAEADNLGVLNDMLAMGRFIDKDGKTRKVDKNFRVIAAANPPDGIYAVNALSGEFIDRMSRLELDYQSEEDEIKLLQSWAPKVSKERIELLVQAAWNLRARYFGWTSRANMLAEDEVPAEKGTYIKRPISTAELRKIVEHFDKYPYDLENRPWSVLNRHFSLANEDPLEVETMKEEIRSEFEGLGFQDKISIDDIIIQKENNQIEVKEDKATGVKTRFWKIKPDKGGKEVKLKLIDEGPVDKNEEPEKLIDEVPRNLVHFYDIAKDISLGNSLLFTGHAGTGKNVIADFAGYMLAGGAYTYLISMNKLTEPGDLTAWRGFAELSDEEKTEWIESFIVKAMREGRPVIIDEVNKADPGVVAILNSLLQTNTLTLPSGEVVEAKPGFCIIATMNPPISGLYEGVEPLSGEFIRRFSIHEFDYLPFEQELKILKRTGKYKVNEKYIERLLMAVGKLREKYIQERAIARPPSMRSLKRTIAYIREHGDHLPSGKKKRKDEQIFEIFEEDFPLDKRTQKEVVKNVFKESDIALLPAGRVDENTPDAIDELLDGQPLVLRGEIEIEPDTGDKKVTDEILKVLQLNYDAVGAGKKIEALAKLIEERISEWSETDFRRHIESALYFREIMKVTLVIRGMAHTKDNLRALEELEQKMEKHLLAYHWPATFFVEAPEIDAGLLKIISHTQDQKINEIFGLLQIFGADEDYRKDLLKNLRQDYVEAKFKDINKARLDEFIDGASLLSKMKRISNNIAGYVDRQEGQALKDLSELISEKLEQSGFPVSSRKFEDKNILWQKYLQVIQKSSGVKNKKEIEAAKKEAEEIFEKAKDLKETRVDSLYSFDIFREKIFELLWGVQTARAPNPIKHKLEQLDKEFVNDLMKEKEWDNKYYDDWTMLKFLWIKDDLSEILTSLNKDNAYRPKECADIIKDYINKIDEQFKTYHWPEYQKLKGLWGFYEEFPIIGGPIKIGLTQGPIALQPAVSAEQIKLWQAELEGLEKTVGQKIEYYSKKEADEWVKNNLTTDRDSVRKLARDIIQNMPKEIDISEFKIKTQKDPKFLKTKDYFGYFWRKGETEENIKPFFSGPQETPALIAALSRIIKEFVNTEKWSGKEELIRIFYKDEDVLDNFVHFEDSLQKWFKEKHLNTESQKLTDEERVFFEKYFDRSAAAKNKYQIILENLEKNGFKLKEEKDGVYQVWEPDYTANFYVTYKPNEDRFKLTLMDNMGEKEVELEEYADSMTFLHVGERPIWKTAHGATFKGLALVDIFHDAKNKKITIVVADDFLPLFEQFNTPKIDTFADGRSYEFIGETEARKKGLLKKIVLEDKAERIAELEEKIRQAEQRLAVGKQIESQPQAPQEISAEIAQLQTLINRFFENEKHINVKGALDKRGEIVQELYPILEDLQSKAIAITDTFDSIPAEGDIDIVYSYSSEGLSFGIVNSVVDGRLIYYEALILDAVNPAYSIMSTVTNTSRDKVKYLPVFSQPQLLSQAEAAVQAAPPAQLSGREEMLRVIGEMEEKQKAEDREQKTEDKERRAEDGGRKAEISEEDLKNLRKRLGLGEEVVGDRELKRELELADGNRVILDYIGDSNNYVEVRFKDIHGEGLNGYVTRYRKRQIVPDESGIIRLSGSKKIYIQYCINRGNHKEYAYHRVTIEDNDLSSFHYDLTSKEKAYGEDVRREIVRLGAEYRINAKCKMQNAKLEKEQNVILGKIKGYFKDEGPDWDWDWDVRALAMRVYQLAGGVFTNRGIDFSFPVEITDDNKDCSLVFIEAAAQLDKFSFNTTRQEDFVEGTEKLLSLGKDNIFVSRRVIRVLKQMFMVWKNEEVKKKIVDILTSAIKPENDDALNMEILEVLDEIWYDEIVVKKLLTSEERKAFTDKIIKGDGYSAQIKRKANKMGIDGSMISRNREREFVTDIDSYSSLDKIGLMELAVEDIKRIKKTGGGDKSYCKNVEKTILKLLDDNELEVRLAAAEALVKLAGDDEVKKEKFRGKIWEMWGAKGSRGPADFIPVYAWVLWALEENRLAVREKMKVAFRKISKATEPYYICEVEDILCEIDISSKKNKQRIISRFILHTMINMDIFDGIRPQIFDYLAEQIDESFKENFASIIDSIIKQLKKKDISPNLKADFANFLKKIYEKVGDKGKEIIRDKISSLSPEIRMAVLPDEALLPVYPDNAGLLENDKTSAEYVERVFGVLQDVIEGKREKGEGKGKKLEIDFAKIKEGRGYDPNEVIRHIDEEIRRSKESLKTESDQKEKDKINEEIVLLEKLIGLIKEKTKVEVEVSSVNYGKACQAYFEAVKKGNEIEISQAYQRLMAEIKAADSLEMVEAMQRMYLYIMQELSVIPMSFAFSRTAGQMGDGRWETEDGKRETEDREREMEDGRRETGEGRRKELEVDFVNLVENVSPVNVVREIRKRLEELKAETLAQIEEALKDKLKKTRGDGRRETKDGELLIKAKQRIQGIDWTQPLRAFKKGKRRFFKYNKEMDINKILSRGQRGGFGMFIIPIPFTFGLLEAETFGELGDRIKGLFIDGKEKLAQLVKRKSEYRQFKKAISKLKLKEFEAKANALEKSLKNAAAKDILLRSKTIIFYSQPVLKNGAVIDLKETLEILLKNNLLNKVILYAEDSVYNDILKDLIEDITPEVKIELLTKKELGLTSRVISNGVKELEALLKGRENILCVIKGRVKAEEERAIKEFFAQDGMPVIILFEKPYKGKLFSLAEALHYAIDGLNKDLPAIAPSQNIQRELREYQQALRGLSGA